MTVNRKRKIILFVSIAIIALLVIRWSNSRSAPVHVLGLTEGRLASCPESPNCVSPQADDAEHRIEPISIEGSCTQAMQRLQEVLKQMPRCRIVSAEGNYLHAQFRSLLLGFVDDVEFLCDEAGNVLHFRSASRVGYSDLGVNRERMEDIRQRFRASSEN